MLFQKDVKHGYLGPVIVSEDEAILIPPTFHSRESLIATENGSSVHSAKSEPPLLRGDDATSDLSVSQEITGLVSLEAPSLSNANTGTATFAPPQNTGHRSIPEDVIFIDPSVPERSLGEGSPVAIPEKAVLPTEMPDLCSSEILSENQFRPDAFQCLCGRPFSYKSGVYRHASRCREKNQHHQCSGCLLSYASRELAISHQAVMRRCKHPAHVNVELT
jgi:hypothetical protein